MTTAREAELLAEIGRLGTELRAAQDALTEERFRDVPRLAEGTEVLVPRLLFGKRKMWPARIVHVHLSYSSGEMPDGTPWETKTVSYAVTLRDKSGEYSSSTVGYYANEVEVR
jgi:hypothetical protein